MTNEPNYQDQVRHKEQKDFSGTVIAKYPIAGLQFLDVRLTNDSIFYKTPAVNWEVTKAYDENND